MHRLHLRSPHGYHATGALPGPARVVPRAVFDARLVDAVTARGGELVQRRVRRLEQRPGYVVLDGEVAARVVIGADGANSVVRRHLGPTAERMAVAIRGYAPTGAADGELLVAVVEQHCPAYAWSFPTGEGTSNIGFGVFDERVAGPAVLIALAGHYTATLASSLAYVGGVGPPRQLLPPALTPAAG